MGVRVSLGGYRAALVRVRCSRGVIKTARLANILRGKTTSCGCFWREKITKHGDAHATKRGTEYNTWAHIIKRCENKNDKDWLYYGGRGITVCPQWRQSYSQFLEDMGRKPTPIHSIDRINNDGNYEPENCQWATKKQQSANRRTCRN